MTAASSWKIPADAPDRECAWRRDQLFHQRHFRSFPLPEKIRAIEKMQQVAEFLARKDRKPSSEGIRR